MPPFNPHNMSHSQLLQEVERLRTTLYRAISEAHYWQERALFLEAEREYWRETAQEFRGR